MRVVPVIAYGCVLAYTGVEDFKGCSGCQIGEDQVEEGSWKKEYLIN